MTPDEHEPTQPSLGALLADWPKFRAEDRAWKAEAEKARRFYGDQLLELTWRVKAMRAERVLAAAIRSRAPELVAAVALVGIAIALFAR